MSRRHAAVVSLSALALLLVGWFAYSWLTYPKDTTAEGAYLRIMSAVNRGKPEEFFAYTETEAQHACHTIHRSRRQARQRVLAAYPEPERSRLAEAYEEEAEAEGAAGVFAVYARRFGWMDHLRRDLSGIATVVVDVERATVETVKGTRYPFRRRPNGIWGITLFTPRLVTGAQKAIRDAEIIEKAAADYERAAKRAEKSVP